MVEYNNDNLLYMISFSVSFLMNASCYVAVAGAVVDRLETEKSSYSYYKV
jgi:hypothetical protein